MCKEKNLYGVVTQFNDGSETLDSYLTKDSALNRAKEIIEHINKNNRVGFKVYLSELLYDYRKNVILSDTLIDDDSILLFKS